MKRHIDERVQMVLDSEKSLIEDMTRDVIIEARDMQRNLTASKQYIETQFKNIQNEFDEFIAQKYGEAEHEINNILRNVQNPDHAIPDLLSSKEEEFARHAAEAMEEFKKAMLEKLNFQ